MAFPAADHITEPDPWFASCWMAESEGFRAMTIDDHYGELRRFALSPFVPAGVHKAFDRARSAMLYAWYDYDLLVVGEHQALSAVELALKACVGGGRPGLAALVKRARMGGVLPSSPHPGAQSIDALVQLRNAFAHGTADVHSPGMALDVLKACSGAINLLFSP